MSRSSLSSSRLPIFAMHLVAHIVWDKYVLIVLPFIFLSLVSGYARAAALLATLYGTSVAGPRSSG